MRDDDTARRVAAWVETSREQAERVGNGATPEGMFSEKLRDMRAAGFRLPGPVVDGVLKTLRGIAVGALLMLPGLSAAQDAPRGRETTRDAFLARAERAAVKRFERMDMDGNGILTAAERAEDRARRSAAWQARQAAIAARRAGSAAPGP